MNKVKKTLAFALAMMLLVGLLAGCGGNSNTNKSNDGGSETSDDATTPPSASNNPDTSKEVNLIYYLWGAEGVANQDIWQRLTRT